MLDEGRVGQQLMTLLGLMKRARDAGTTAEMSFMLVNDTRALAVYRQAALWFAEGGVQALSGVIQPEANAPYVHWLERVCAQFSKTYSEQPTLVSAASLTQDDAREWADWLPEYGLWLPVSLPGEAAPGGRAAHGGLLLAGDSVWPAETVSLLQEWVDAWSQSWQARQRQASWSWRRVRDALLGAWRTRAAVPWWKQPRLRWLAGIAVVLLFPVRLTVLAPGELVPAHPAVIRAPLDGVIEQFDVKPNAVVKAGQPLFRFDEAAITARRDTAAQQLAAAEAEYRAAAQDALADDKSRNQLATLLGKVEEKRADATYYNEQYTRSHVVAPSGGIAMVDDPTDWIGKPVQTGERIMSIAAPDDKEVEIWLPLGEAIDLPPGAEVKLYLAASPLSAVTARVRYVAYESQVQPDGLYAYRVRATLDGASSQRVGEKGTAKLYGGHVPFVYWVLRRPLAVIRQRIGL
ncbi:HlyD family efflux transporter periplasmic adaptor subunit [Paraburkholderia acidisoli]|uniref:HlyD family efflux transporter periplasmic adaptor subunit n=1 Tax=Paraburkholderia acidisoli TaxID=2571748 RepID=A0A7Z2GQ50_9BURK|nr:HlyD family secretion protein [Paraburkholderia acidisoli]QGZ65509.1 HlyD family efflux transporter periplasmic adaptor subunit [Paraburkholderia acidisoli]